MKFSIYIKSIFIFSTVFILFTVIGTISHEYGHIAVARMLGYNTVLHYSSMNYSLAPLNEKIIRIYYENESSIINGNDFEAKEQYESLIEKRRTDILIVSIGGPIQTIITGIFGLLIIFWRRNKIKSDGLKLIDWLAVFLSLFWLREVFNLIMSISHEIISPNGTYFGGDELKISKILNLWQGSVSIILGLTGLAISLFIIFRIVPYKLRLTFIISGLIGGIAGFILWMDIIGPIIIP